jgi:ABC-type multidrug transport system permease subunit
MLRHALFIAGHDLRFMLRQWETLLWTFVMPVLFFYFIGTMTGGFAAATRGGSPPLAVQAPANGGIVVDQLVARLEEQGYAVARPATREAFERFDRRLIVPEPATGTGTTVTDSVLAGNRLHVTFERRGDDLAATLDEVRLNRAIYTVVADLAAIKANGREATKEAFDAIAAAPRRVTLNVRAAGERPKQPPAGFAQAVPGTMVMFTMLVLLTSGAIMLVVEREHGLLRRLASAPISRASLVLGKWLARVALALVQLAFAMVLGSVLFRVDWGQSVPMVFAVLAAWAALNASLALLLGSVARTPAQATGIGVLSSLAFAALGGCWWPIEITPAWMQSLALALPSGWTMDALHKLVSFGYAPGTALPHVAVLAAAALVAGWGAAKTFRYQ